MFKEIEISLTKSQIIGLKEFFEIEFIPSIQHDENCDNIDYLVDMCDVYKKLKEVHKNIV